MYAMHTCAYCMDGSYVSASCTTLPLKAYIPHILPVNPLSRRTNAIDGRPFGDIGMEEEEEEDDVTVTVVWRWMLVIEGSNGG